MADNYALPPRTRVINLINEDNPGANISLQKVTLGPVEVSTINNRNTSILLTSIPGQGTLGTQRIWYNRLGLASYFQNVTITVQVNNPQSSFDLLLPIRQQYNTDIEEDDIVLEAISGSSYTLKAAAGSYGWIGQVIINIMPVQYPLETLLDVLNLDVFTTGSIYETSVSQLLAAVNAANGTSIATGTVAFSLPVVDTSVSGTNTRVRISALTGQGYTGFVDIHYSRIEVSSVYPDGIDMNGNYQVPVNGLTLRSQLQASNNVQLTSNEVQNVSIATGVRDVFLTLSNLSLVWAPNGVLGVTLPKIPMSMGYATRALVGFENGDITIDGYTQLLQLANTTNSRSFTLSDITFSSIQPIPLDQQDGYGRNTTITATALSGNPTYIGSVDLTYKRIPVTASYSDPFSLSQFSYATTHDVLARLESVLSFELANQHVIDASAAGTPVTMTIANTHPIWLPGSTFLVNIAQPSGGDNLLLDGGGNFLLDGGGQLLLD